MFAARDPANHLRIGRAFHRKTRDRSPELHIPDNVSPIIADHGNKHDTTTSTTAAAVAAVAAPAPPVQTSPANDNGNTSQSNAAASQVVDFGADTGGNQAAPPANSSSGPASDSPPGSPTPGSGSSDPSITNTSINTATTSELAPSNSNTSSTANALANSDAQPATKSIADTTPTPTSPSTGFLAKPTTVSSSHPNSPNGNSDPSSATTNSNVNPPAQHGISKGAIVAIATILSLLLLGFLLFVLRRRSILRRTERRQRWWFGRSGSNQNGNDDNTHTWGRDSPDRIPRSGTLSTRSSFATTFDHGLTPASTVNFEGLVPALPPMAEIRGEHGSFFVHESGDRETYPSPASVLTSIDSSDNHSRNFAYSASTGSIPSDLSVQYHTVQPAAASTSNSDYLPILSSGGATTPMSVRPFSPSESFAFPQPPGEQLSELSSIHSRPQSTATAKSPTAWSDNARTLTPKVTPTPLIIVHTSEIPNPFFDPSSSSPAPSQVEFEEFETIHRSFAPTRDDELRVSPGDSVRILNMFNDGWALAEMVPSSGEGPALIPIDCLRKPGQELPAFLEAKKVSSYAGYEGC